VFLSIVTPSFRNSQWLQLCIASVADQQVLHEHIIQDACSDDDTQHWLPSDTRVSAFIEKDSGMYDAVNRGFRRARGDVLSYINCDEQYLPGALTRVGNYFEQHPHVHVLFGDVIVVDPAGAYICERKALIPQALHSMVSGNLSFLTAATFVRRSFVEKHGLYFDPTLRTAGDADWALRLIKAGARMAVLREFLSTFTETSANLGRSDVAVRESAQMKSQAPLWAQFAAPGIILHYRLRRMLGGAYKCTPHDYSIYTRHSPQSRQTFRVSNPTFRWKRA
jgi:glycosyltransferase involved in cell wall biosynthesis